MAGARAGELAAPACSGALALRRITALLTSARRADAQGEFSQARDLYVEVLKVQRTLSRAPLGSIGKSLREVVVGVEARLQQLQPALRETDSTTCSSSRPSTHCSVPSASSKSSAANGVCTRGGQAAPGQHVQEELLPPHFSGCGPSRGSSRPLNGIQSGQITEVSWDTTGIPDCPLSARDGYGGRPTTRDGGRDGSLGLRPCTEGGRPATSDCWSRQGGLGLSTLDGTRPCTRDDIRLQQQLDGTRPSARERKNGSREANITPRRPSREKPVNPSTSHPSHPSCDDVRPATRDSVRPPTQSGPRERRCQDVTIRQVTGRRKRQPNQQVAADVLNLEAMSPIGSPSPEYSALGDESVELLE